MAAAAIWFNASLAVGILPAIWVVSWIPVVAWRREKTIEGGWLRPYPSPSSPGSSSFSPCGLPSASGAAPDTITPVNPLVIVDYGAGNLRSVQKAFEHLGHEAVFTSSPADLKNAPAVIFPGQGASPPAMAALERDGMADAIREAIAAGTPFFGVCLGLQLLLEHSEEGGVDCLGVIPGTVRKFDTTLSTALPQTTDSQPSSSTAAGHLKVPHMGWNAVKLVGEHPVFEGIPEQSYFYFVHSYYADPSDDSWVEGTTTYGMDFTSVVARDNLVATQFHPEKSGNVGLKLYDNFVKHVVLTRGQ
jgi:glutamine amidotransferase